MDFGFVLVYFVYGLAFFSMGLAMLFEARRSPLLAEARALWPLALFGLIHGTHEWLEMLLIIRKWFGLAAPGYFAWVRLLMLVVSFFFLAVFAMQILRPEKRYERQNIIIVAAVLALFGLLVFITKRGHPLTAQHWIAHADVLARYTLAIPGAALAALALNRQAHQAYENARISLGRNLRLAAVGFAFYGVAQVVVGPLDLFPARYINTVVFNEFFGFPVQAVRAAMALVVTVGLVRASQIVEDERQRQLDAARQARLEALAQTQRDLEEKEDLRRELLRHTVIAQEEERARIARELHDETAQFLTALTLNLATLRSALPKGARLSELLDRLQSLSQQMSQGISRMVRDLRPAQLDDLGLEPALAYLVDDERRRSGLEISMEVGGSRRRLDPLVETVLFRVAQEALTNVIRHAHADKALLQLEFHPAEAVLRVQDWGVGFDKGEELKPPRGWGIAGMRERVESVGGELRLESALGRGTLVEAAIPFSNEDTAAIKEEDP
jgi:signal transduction histidine kinase